MGTVDQTKITPRPDYEDGDIDKLHLGYDLFELKYDGIWGRIDIDTEGSDGVVRIYSRTGQLKETFKIRQWDYPGVTLHSEFMHGSNWGIQRGLNGQAFVFDMTRLGEVDLSKKSLGLRRAEAARICGRLAAFGMHRFKLVQQYPMSDLRKVWATKVLEEGYEGVVLKNSLAPFGSNWVRIKRELEVDFVCLGFEQSESAKYKGRMVKSIETGLYVNGKLTSIAFVGGGLKEHERLEYFQHPELYIGKPFKVSCKRVFPSGSPRHPSFNGWHQDKRAIDCTIDAVRKIAGNS